MVVSWWIMAFCPVCIHRAITIHLFLHLFDAVAVISNLWQQGLLKVPDDSVVDMHFRDMKCAVHDLGVMGLNPSRVKLEVPV